MVGAGTQTTVLPAARAGANSSAPIVYGQFHGLITPITPSGTRVVSIRRPAEVEAGNAPVQPLGVLGGHPEVLGQLVDLVVGLRGQRLALVLGQHPGQLLAAGADRAATTSSHQPRPLERRRPRPSPARPRGPPPPRRRRPPRCRDRDRGERLAGGRADRRRRAARRRAATRRRCRAGARPSVRCLAQPECPRRACPARRGGRAASGRRARRPTARPRTPPSGPKTGAATATSPSSSSATAVA